MFGLAVDNRTTYKIPLALFRRVLVSVLGPRYELSLVICGDARTLTLNKKYRGKNKPANVLSFPLSKTAGEIFLNTSRAAKEADLYSRTANEHVIALYVHGLLHLKGLSHGKLMDKKENSLKKTLNLKF